MNQGPTDLRGLGLNRPGARVPQVSEVLERLHEEFGREASQRPVLFQAALRICAEESRRAKRGEPSAGIDILVERARAILLSPRGQAELRAALPGAAAAPPASPPTAPPEPLVEPDEAQLPETPPPMGGALTVPAVTSIGGDENEPEPATRVPRLSRRLPLVLLGLSAAMVLTYFGVQRFTRHTPSAPAPAAPAVPAPSTGAQPPHAAPASRGAAGAAPTAAQPAPPVAARVPEPATPPRVAPTTTPPRTTPPPAPTAGWAQSMVSPDWAGREPTYVVQLSSFRDRQSAESQARRAAARYGRPAYAAEVAIPDRGVWYRVVVGDFATAADARGFRNELVAAGTKDVGAVYWLTAG